MSLMKDDEGSPQSWNILQKRNKQFLRITSPETSQTSNHMNSFRRNSITNHFAMNPIVEEGSCGLFGLRKHSMIPEEQFNLQSSAMQKDSSKTQIQQRGHSPSGNANSTKSKKRLKKRKPQLRCPICHRVWTSDWNGLCSHSIGVHRIPLENWPLIKDLLELRAQKLNDLNATVHLGRILNDFGDTHESDLHYDISTNYPEYMDITSGFISHNSISKNSNAVPPCPRNVRSLSDFGVRPKFDCQPTRERSASIPPLNAPQLEEIYQNCRQMKSHKQTRQYYMAQQEDKNQIINLVRPTAVAEVVAIDEQIEEQIIGNYSLKFGSKLDSMDLW